MTSNGKAGAVARLAVVLALSGCGPVPEVETRLGHWRREVDLFFAEARTMDDLHRWLRARDVIYTFEDRDIVDGHWATTLEKIYPDTVRCDWVDIKMSVSVDDLRRIQGHSLEKYGACWW